MVDVEAFARRTCMALLAVYFIYRVTLLSISM